MSTPKETTAAARPLPTGGEAAGDAAQPPPAPVPGLPPEVRRELAELTVSAVAQTLSAMGITAAAKHPQANPEDMRPQDDPTYEEGPRQQRIPFETGLFQRHADWLKNTARNFGMSTESMLELLVRRAYAADPTKGGTILVALPSEKGQLATSAPRNR